jgi:hypothetical protein
VSLLTPPIEDETTTAFYARVRPFGFWRDAAAKAKAAGLAMATAIPVPRIILNVALGLVASFPSTWPRSISSVIGQLKVPSAALSSPSAA